MKIIVPCAGQSSRYPNMPPKWILPDHDGVPMIARAIENLRFDPKDLVVTILAEHEERFDVQRGLEEVFSHPVATVVLEEETKSQSETIYKTLQLLDIDEPFFVKDSDNSFHIDKIEAPANYITVASLNDFDLINPRNKSYVTVSNDGVVTCIREKRVISDLFSVGGYYFCDPRQFNNAFEILSKSPEYEASEIYVSEVISYLLLNGENFMIKKCENYQDWGTVHEWKKKLESRKQFFVSVDGFLFERCSLYFSPSFNEVKPHKSAIKAVCDLANAGHQVIYLSTRPQELKEQTLSMLGSAGLPVGQLIMGCDLAQWKMVTSPHPTIPYTTSEAREVMPDDFDIYNKLCS